MSTETLAQLLETVRASQFRHANAYSSVLGRLPGVTGKK